MRYLGLTALVLVACATEQQGSSALARRDAIYAANRALNEGTYRSRDGFQSTRWGMTRDEVASLYPAAESLPRGDLALSMNVAEHPARVVFLFTKGRLGVVHIRFTQFEDIRIEHKALAELLTTKYGIPSEDVDTAQEAAERVGQHRLAADLVWSSAKINEALSGAPADTYKQSRIDASAERAEAEAQQQAISAQSDFILQKKWETSETGINLFGRRIPDEDMLFIDYESIMLAPRLHQELEMERLEHKKEQAKDL
ncbi:hypothetical protein [Archangium sp.]|uniref:hypothetical protein n=1 Tax=Archangium sp. TaxID=1872627 RepID=UPI00389B235D